MLSRKPKDILGGTIQNRLGALKKDLEELEAELQGLERKDGQSPEKHLPVETSSERQISPEEEYKNRLAKAPVFVSCWIAKEAFDTETNILKALSDDVANAIVIGTRDECGGLDEEEKLADVLQYGFIRPGLAAPGGIQAVLKFRDMFDLDYFRRNKPEGLKRIDKYYTPPPRADFTGAALANREERLKMCVEHDFAGIQQKMMQTRHAEIVAMYDIRRQYVQKQIARLTNMRVQDSDKWKNFNEILSQLDTKLENLRKMQVDHLSSRKLDQYNADIIRIDHWIQDVASVHRHTGVKGFFAGNSYRNPKSLNEYEQEFSTHSPG